MTKGLVSEHLKHCSCLDDLHDPQSHIVVVELFKRGHVRLSGQPCLCLLDLSLGVSGCSSALFCAQAPEHSPPVPGSTYSFGASRVPGVSTTSSLSMIHSTTLMWCSNLALLMGSGSSNSALQLCQQAPRSFSCFGICPGSITRSKSARSLDLATYDRGWCFSGEVVSEWLRKGFVQFVQKWLMLLYLCLHNGSVTTARFMFPSNLTETVS